MSCMREKHCEVIVKSGEITDEDLSVGCDLYCRLGAGDLKNKAV